MKGWGLSAPSTTPVGCRASVSLCQQQARTGSRGAPVVEELIHEPAGRGGLLRVLLLSGACWKALSSISISQIACLTLACWNPHTRALLIGPFILATPPNNKGPAPG